MIRRVAVGLAVAAGLAVTAGLTGVLLAPAAASAADLVRIEPAGAGTTLGLWVARLLDTTALSATVGLLLVPAVLLADDGAGAALLDEVGGRAARAAACAALTWAAAAGLLYLFALSAAAARPLGQVLQPALLGRFAATRFGSAVLVQAAVALLVAGLAAGARTRAGAAVALAGAGLGALAPGWWGHGATSGAPAVAIAAHGLHVLAAAVWAGGLGALAGVLLADPEPVRVVDASRRFSRIAGWALVAVGASGAVNALLRIGAPGNLLGTGWGRLLLVKVLLFSAVGLLGARHRSRSLPALAASSASCDARRGFRVLARAELVLMAAAFAAATGMASGMPPDVEAGARVQSVAAAFGDGQLNLSIDPAVAGDNVVHLYVLDASGLPRPAEEVTVSLASDQARLAVPVLPAGPGHFSAPSFTVAEPGVYTVRVTGVLDTGPASASGMVVIRPG